MGGSNYQDILYSLTGKLMANSTKKCILIKLVLLKKNENKSNEEKNNRELAPVLRPRVIQRSKHSLDAEWRLQDCPKRESICHNNSTGFR